MSTGVNETKVEDVGSACRWTFVNKRSNTRNECYHVKQDMLLRGSIDWIELAPRLGSARVGSFERPTYHTECKASIEQHEVYQVESKVP